MEQIIIFWITALSEYVGILSALIVAFYASLIVFALAPKIFSRRD